MTEEKTREIPLGDGYFLKNDPYCWWIEKEYINKKSGKPYRKNLTMYCISLENAFETLGDYHTKAFDTKSIRILIKEVKALKTEIRALIGELNERI